MIYKLKNRKKKLTKKHENEEVDSTSKELGALTRVSSGIVHNTTNSSESFQV